MSAKQRWAGHAIRPTSHALMLGWLVAVSRRPPG
jgi:hypothetical protein